MSTLLPPFAVETLPFPGVTVVAVSGEVDMATAPQLDRWLFEAPLDLPLIADLCDCAFLDSTGLMVLLRHHLRSHGFAVAAEPGGMPDRAFSWSGVGTVDKHDPARLLVFPSRGTAVAGIADRPEEASTTEGPQPNAGGGGRGPYAP